MFSNDQVHRYSRHILLPEIGVKGQTALSKSKVLVIGAGGLGSPVIQYLSAAGIGLLGIMDHDIVDLSNMQRQTIHDTNDIGKLKVYSAKEKVALLNPDVQVKVYPYAANISNIKDILNPYDLVIDCCDNFSTRYLVNDTAYLLKKPYFYGAAVRFDGHAAVFYPTKGPCYRCIFPELPTDDNINSCAESGVFNVVPGIIGLIQASEALKWLLGIGDALLGRLIVFNALSMNFREISVKSRSSCDLCGVNPTIIDLKEENYIPFSCTKE